MSDILISPQPFKKDARHPDCPDGGLSNEVTLISGTPDRIAVWSWPRDEARPRDLPQCQFERPVSGFLKSGPFRRLTARSLLWPILTGWKTGYYQVWRADLFLPTPHQLLARNSFRPARGD